MYIYITYKQSNSKSTTIIYIMQIIRVMPEEMQIHASSSYKTIRYVYRYLQINFFISKNYIATLHCIRYPINYR